ncbi:MAG TPA: cobalamin-binding protein [Thermoplasmata archaeon]|nr:cobalamin-binding protein [Thermoplasmata archaeon]
MRIASLLPSATEIVYVLGLGESLVGRSPECDFPLEVSAKPVISASVFDGTDLDSASIDATVRRHLESPEGAGSLYHIDVEKLRAVRPDLILTQGLCDVCAASVDEVRDAASALDAPPEVVSLDPTSLDEILEDILVVGEKAGRPAAAVQLVRDLRARLEEVRAKTEGADRPTVACIEWFDPIFNAGHWVPQQVEYAGGREVLGTFQKPSRTIPWELVLAAEPDVLVLMPCGFDVPRAIKEARSVTAREGFEALPAVREGRVYVVNGSAYFNRPGPRTVDGVELLAHLIHPELFPEPWPDDAARRLT